MAGIYIHIPFCKQACHYCDFHFSTSRKKQFEMVLALAKEILLRMDETDEKIETIYFGGGTPSLLSNAEIDFLLDSIYKSYSVADEPEITLEANPDDLSQDRVRELSKTRINRLSIGIQSFFDDDLKMMNRAHNSSEASGCISEAAKYFDNISVDLIYGIPGSDDVKWKENIRRVLAYDIPHVSAYALTVEPKTALQKMIASGAIASPEDEHANRQFHILVEELERSGFVHYELSNFGKPGYFSRNNTAYWLGKKYIGIGPSAHSFDGRNRSWNVSNNALYLKSLFEETLPSETETLSKNDLYNEYVMTGLRTIWGISLSKVESDFGKDHLSYLLKSARKYFDGNLLELKDDTIKTTKDGKFLTDGIASDLFLINLRN